MNKKVFSLLLLSILLSQTVFAEEQNIPIANKTSYEKGVEYINTNQFTKAIQEFRNALSENPSAQNTKLQLINSYILRAKYYNNTLKDYNKAANDIRSAIFYIKYFENKPVDTNYIHNLNILEDNLAHILYSINADETPKGRFLMGKSLRVQGELPAAAVEFHKITSDTNYQKEAIKNLGEIYYALSRYEQATTYLEQAVSYYKQNPDLHIKLANSYERLNKPEKAAFEYNAAMSVSNNDKEVLETLDNIWTQKIKQNPNDAEAHANLGAIYQRQKLYDKATEQYKIAESLNPSNITTRLNFGTLYQAKKDYNTAIEAYDTIIAFNPNYMPAYWYKAQCYKELGNNTAAIQNYKLALNLDPTNQNIKNELYEMTLKNLSGEQKIQFLAKELVLNPSDAALNYQYAYELHKAGNINDAIKYYEQSIKINQLNENAHINLARAYQQAGNFEAAKSTLNKALKIFPNNDVITKQLASIDAEKSSNAYTKASELFHTKKYNEAIALYKTITPPTAEALIGVGACYQSIDQYNLAADAFEKAFRLDDKNSDTAYYAALAYSNLQNYEKAKEYARKSIAINAANKNAKELLTYVIEQENTEKMDKAMELFEKQNYTQALSLLNTVIEQDNKDANAYYYRAMVYDAQKKYNLAINDYKKAIENNSEMLIANYAIAVDFDYLAQYSNALSYYKRYLSSTQKIGETNDYTRYSAKRIQDLKNYEAKYNATASTKK